MLTATDLLSGLHRVATTVPLAVPFLTDLDAAIGDADHGVNMHLGFQAVLEELPVVAGDDVEGILGHVGSTLIAAIGGASGPLYGAAFTEAAKAAGHVQSLYLPDVARLLEAARDGVARRGHTRVGEKTMLDALEGAAQAAAASAHDGLSGSVAAARIVDGAISGLLATRDLVARRGRAMRLGQRSVGHLDPGAASCCLIIGVICGLEWTELGPRLQRTGDVAAAPE